MDYKQLRKEVEKDQELKNMKLNDSDLWTAYQYLRLRDTNDNPNFVPTLKQNDVLEIVMVPTKEHQELRNRQKNMSNVGTLDTVNYLLDAKLSDFKLSNNERKEAYIKASRFTELVKEGKAQKGLYLHGKYGTGKTYLISAIVEEVAKEKKVLFIYFPDLVRNLKSSFSSNDLEDKVTALKTCDLLVFDDMGSENMSGWFRDEILAPILQFRLASNLPILISSNLSQKQIIDNLAEDRSGIDNVKAARIAHRIKELTEEVSLSESYQNI